MLKFQLDVRDGDHLENYVNFMKWESLKQIRKLREDVNRNVYVLIFIAKFSTCDRLKTTSIILFQIGFPSFVRQCFLQPSS